MAIVFRAGNPNFPLNQDELNKRLEEIEQLVNKYDANIPFCESAFKLIEDCDLITEDNIRFLCSAQACKKYDPNFWFIRNRKEGVLRPTEDYNNVFTGKYQRFYSGFDMRMEFYEQTFLIVNDWYKDFSEDRYSHQRKSSPCPNKRAFYNWLNEKAQNACEKYWTEQKHSKESETIDILKDFDIFDDIFDIGNIESTSIDKFTYSPSGISIDSYIGSAEHVTIPAWIDGLPVTCIGNRAFKNCTSLIEITIPEGVTSIGYKAFENCENLKSVIIPNSVTSIEDSAFSNCWSLTKITIPHDVKFIGDYAFLKCECLKSIKIPDNVTSIGDGTFYGCKSLESITIPNGIMSIGSWAFWNCTSLRNIIIPESVTKIGDKAFSWCTNLDSIVIPDKVYSIGDAAFWGCKSLTEITIPDSVIFIDAEVFRDCTSLTKITIPDNVGLIFNDAFSGCEHLEVIYINNSKLLDDIRKPNPSCKILPIPKK